MILILFWKMGQARGPISNNAATSTSASTPTLPQPWVSITSVYPGQEGQHLATVSGFSRGQLEEMCCLKCTVWEERSKLSAFPNIGQKYIIKAQLS